MKDARKKLSEQLQGDRPELLIVFLVLMAIAVMSVVFYFLNVNGTPN